MLVLAAERSISLTVFTKVVPLDKEHEHRIEFFVSVHDPDQVAGVSLCINLTVVVPPKKVNGNSVRSVSSVFLCVSVHGMGCIAELGMREKGDFTAIT